MVLDVSAGHVRRWQRLQVRVLTAMHLRIDPKVPANHSRVVKKSGEEMQQASGHRLQVEHHPRTRIILACDTRKHEDVVARYISRYGRTLLFHNIGTDNPEDLWRNL